MRPWLFFLELRSLTPCLPIGALICWRRRDLGRIAESIQNNLSHLLHASFCCSSTAQPVQLFRSRSLQCSTYLKVVLPCSYCSLLLILECSVFFFLSPLPHALHQAVRSSGSLLSLLPHLPIMLCSSASLPLPLPYHLQ